MKMANNNIIILKTPLLKLILYVCEKKFSTKKNVTILIKNFLANLVY